MGLTARLCKKEDSERPEEENGYLKKESESFTTLLTRERGGERDSTKKGARIKRREAERRGQAATRKRERQKRIIKILRLPD